MALGARVPEITGMVLRQGMAPTALGLAAGLGLSLLGGRLMQGLLYQVEPREPTVLAGATALVAVVALLAVVLPARRALRVDPTEALRSE